MDTDTLPPEVKSLLSTSKKKTTLTSQVRYVLSEEEPMTVDDIILGLYYKLKVVPANRNRIHRALSHLLQSKLAKKVHVPDVGHVLWIGLKKKEVVKKIGSLPLGSSVQQLVVGDVDVQ